MSQPLEPSWEYMRMRRAFGCGVDPVEFRRMYDALEPREREKLDRVAQRMWVSLVLRLQLRNRVGIAHPAQSVVFPDFLFHAAEVPSLEIFYLFGCLDTLTPNNFQAFPDWLNNSEVRGRLDLEHATFTTDKVAGLYRMYEEERGVGANLRRLFASLPTAINTWLASNVRIEEAGQDTLPSLEAAIQVTEHVTKHLFYYFYKKRRNPFAHESASPITAVASDIKRGDGWHVLLSNINTENRPSGFWSYRVEGKDWLVYLRNGIDEATVLRIILYGVALQRMGVDVTGMYVDAFFGGLSRQVALFRLPDQ